MIELYTGPRPTATRSTSCSRRSGCPTRSHPVDIGEGDQFKPEFLKISPNNKIPAIVDSDGPGRQADLACSSRARSCIYLAEKTGKLLPKEHARPLRGRCSG